LEALQTHQAQGNLRLKVLVTMPDHLHFIAQINQAVGIRGPIGNIKRYLARRHSILWQRGFFDHRIRSDKLLRRTEHYVRMNPVRAGLVKNPEDWPYRWPPRMDDSSGDGPSQGIGLGLG
jgi:putative transposase